MGKQEPFSFKEHTKKEQSAINKEQRALKKATDAAAQALRDCITSDTFIKYRKELELSDKGLVEVGIDILKTIRNKDERLALYDALFVRADVLSLLLKGVEKDKS